MELKKQIQNAIAELTKDRDVLNTKIEVLTEALAKLEGFEEAPAGKKKATTTRKWSKAQREAASKRAKARWRKAKREGKTTLAKKKTAKRTARK